MGMQENLDEANRTIDELRAELSAANRKIRDQAAEAGRNVDDRFRSAVDPLGQSAETRLGLKQGSMKDPVRIIAWILVAVIVIGVLIWILNE